MKKRHKHADIIIAWSEGAEIEYRKDPDRPWVPLPSQTNWYTYEGVEYRIKPPVKKYRVALFNTSSGGVLTFVANDEEQERSYEAMYRFVRWLTDWIEYEE